MEKAKNSGTLFTTGYGEMGQLGFESEEKSVPTIVDAMRNVQVTQVVCGGLQTWILTVNGEVWSFGNNDEGSLGRTTGDEMLEIYPGKVMLPRPCIQLAGGDAHCAALLDSGKVFGWGSFQVLMQSEYFGVNVETLGTTQPTLISGHLPKIVTKIASGAKHIVMLCADGIVYTHGDGTCGQLGRKLPHRFRGDARVHLLTPTPVQLIKSSRRQKAINIWAGEFSTFIQCRTSFWVFGNNNWHQSGVSHSRDLIAYPRWKNELASTSWACIAGGEFHTICTDTLGRVFSFGRNTEGQCGILSTDECFSKPISIPALNDIRVSKVATGSRTSFALTDNGVLYCWGVGEWIGIGNANVLQRSPVKLVMPNENGREFLKVVDIDGGGQHAAMVFI